MGATDPSRRQRLKKVAIPRGGTSGLTQDLSRTERGSVTQCSRLRPVNGELEWEDTRPAGPATLTPHVCPRTQAWGRSWRAKCPPRGVWKPSEHPSVREHVSTVRCVRRNMTKQEKCVKHALAHPRGWISTSVSQKQSQFQMAPRLYPHVYCIST